MYVQDHVHMIKVNSPTTSQSCISVYIACEKVHRSVNAHETPILSYSETITDISSYWPNKKKTFHAPSHMLLVIACLTRKALTKYIFRDTVEHYQLTQLVYYYRTCPQRHHPAPLLKT